MLMKTITLQKGVIKDTPEVKVEKNDATGGETWNVFDPFCHDSDSLHL